MDWNGGIAEISTESGFIAGFASQQQRGHAGKTGGLSEREAGMVKYPRGAGWRGAIEGWWESPPARSITK
jgi:hypothetical protein